jgi:hypothetical protein
MAYPFWNGASTLLTILELEDWVGGILKAEILPVLGTLLGAIFLIGCEGNKIYSAGFTTPLD